MWWLVLPRTSFLFLWLGPFLSTSSFWDLTGQCARLFY
jgi:hypothetical protein